MHLTYEGMKFSGTLTDMKKYLEEKVEREEAKELMEEKMEANALEDKI